MFSNEYIFQQHCKQVLLKAFTFDELNHECIKRNGLGRYEYLLCRYSVAKLLLLIRFTMIKYNLYLLYFIIVCIHAYLYTYKMYFLLP